MARFAPRIRNSGDLSAGSATITVRSHDLLLNTSAAKLATSRARSPISPTTTTSAAVNLVIMPNKTDLPTPDPAIIPIRWPWPTVSKLLITRTPTSSCLSTGRRANGLVFLPLSGQLWLSSSGAPSSSGCPNASIARPSNSGPTLMLCPSSLTTTRAPTLICASWSCTDKRL